MKLETTQNRYAGEPKSVTATTLRLACATCYQSVSAQIAAAREAIIAESKQAIAAPERLVHLALKEAEALAWETTYPQLVFPTLAAEKVQAVATWSSNQKAVRRSSPVFTLTE